MTVMNREPRPADREVLIGLIERVTYQNTERHQAHGMPKRLEFACPRGRRSFPGRGARPAALPHLRTLRCRAAPVERALIFGVIAPQTLLGIAFAVLVAPLTSSVMSSVPKSDEGLASGINNAASRVVTARRHRIGCRARHAEFRPSIWIVGGRSRVGGRRRDYRTRSSPIDETRTQLKWQTGDTSPRGIPRLRSGSRTVKQNNRLGREKTR
jgi:hypothetical protein